jgi:hypothetical protein
MPSLQNGRKEVDTVWFQKSHDLCSHWHFDIRQNENTIGRRCEISRFSRIAKLHALYKHTINFRHSRRQSWRNLVHGTRMLMMCPLQPDIVMFIPVRPFSYPSRSGFSGLTNCGKAVVSSSLDNPKKNGSEYLPRVSVLHTLWTVLWNVSLVSLAIISPRLTTKVSGSRLRLIHSPFEFRT